MYKGLVKNICGATVILMLIAMPGSAQTNTGFVQGASPYIGTELVDGSALVIGSRFDIGAFPIIHFRVVPEFASTITDTNASFLLNLGLQANLFGIKIGETRKLVPYVRGGGGVLWQQSVNEQAILNFAGGLTLQSTIDPTGTRLFAEFQGLDKFNKNRILVGLSLGR